jgi:hypothetical protein
LATSNTPREEKSREKGNIRKRGWKKEEKNEREKEREREREKEPIRNCDEEIPGIS